MRLKEYRLKKGLTQEEVAIHLSIPKKTYQNYEREVREPDSVVLSSLADLYGISLDELVGRDAGSPIVNDLGQDSEEIVNLLASMDEHGKKALLAIARTLASVFPKD